MEKQINQKGLSSKRRKLFLGIILIQFFFFNSLIAQIHIDIVPNKTNCVAPFKLLVDAKGTSATGIEGTWAFHNLEYEWDFGDPNAGTWLTDGKDRNKAFGPVYGHVYEKPGNYTITLLVTNPLTAETASKSFSITVEDPDVFYAGTNTICVSTSSNFDGAPEGALLITSNDYKEVIETYANGGKRVLFRRGDEWHVSNSPLTRLEDGPSTIGAFGSGPKPHIIAETGCGRFLTLSDYKLNETKNWRIMDMEFDGNNIPSAVGIQLGGHDILALRLDIHHVDHGVGFGESALDWNWKQGFRPLLHSDFGVIDCTIKHIGKITAPGGGVGIYGACEGLLILGNKVYDNTNGEHNIRLTYANTGVLGHNQVSNPAWTKQNLTLRSLDWEEVGGFMENKFSGNMVISDNYFYANYTTIMIQTGVGNNGEDRPKTFDVIFERNYIESEEEVTTTLDIRGYRNTVRNNIINRKDGGICMTAAQHESAFVDDTSDIKIYNNTFRSNYIKAVMIFKQAYGVEIYNNVLILDDRDQSDIVYLKESTVPYICEDNIVTLNTGMASTAYEFPADFRLTEISPLRNMGRNMPTLTDYDTNFRQYDNFDVGAYQYAGPITEVPVKGVLLNDHTLTLDDGDCFQMYKTISPANATNRSVKWVSSNPSVVTVNSNGYLNAVGIGTSTITVTTVDGGYTDQCLVTVNQVEVTGLNLIPANLTLEEKVGSSALIAEIIPANATHQGVTWSTSDASVASVVDGVVSAGIIGEAIITAKTDEGGFTDTCFVEVIDSPCDGTETNVSSGKPAVASTIENDNRSAAAAFDGNPTTRWSSVYSDPQWIYVDLGESYTIVRIVLNWEAAYASAYQIQVSDDATNWSDIYSTTRGDGNIDDITVSGNGRYVRMYGASRATQWGYSLYEFDVYGCSVEDILPLTESFENLTASTTGNTTGTYTGDNGEIWNYWTVQKIANGISGVTAQLGQNGSYVETIIPDGLQELSFTMQTLPADTLTLGSLEVFVNGSSQGLFTTDLPAITKTYMISKINQAGAVALRFQSASAWEVWLDDIRWSDFGSSLINNNYSSLNTGIDVYPNPVKQDQILYIGVEQASTIRIMDMKGVVIYQSQINDNPLKISSNIFYKGMYIISVVSEKGVSNVKLIVK